MRGSIRVGDAAEGVDAIAYVAGREALDWLRGVDPAASRVIELGDFKAGLEETALIYRLEGVPRLILSGAGGEDEWIGHAERLRVAVAAAVKQARRLRQIRRLGIVVEKGLLEKAASEGRGERWAVEQALIAADMANYVYSLHGRGDRPHVLDEIRIGPGDEKALESASAIAEGVRLARDLANAPANIMGPDGLEDAARELAKRLGLGIRVLHRGELESLGMGGILAVGSGSDKEPRLIVLEYHGGGRRVAVVGKAVAFDSGGLDLKPSQYMLEMKYDKSGGAAAMGIIAAAARLRLPVELVALIPAVENMPSGRSYKPLDVIKMYNGLTVEVGNTDAEGRLILADALAYAAEKYKPDAMIDLATLTGAAVVALGNHAAALMSNNEDLASGIEKAAWAAGEPAWRLPMWPVYEKQLESKVADTNNIGGRWAGAITAAKFLEKFVDGRPWAHLDIAGVAWVQEKGPWKPYYHQGGATGWGVRTVVEYLRGL
ncbi:peptidase M17 [Pyrodictium occultum]|uniref:Probable cytosol aminopeptidase n=1 Tax=Pyrodictium occultum TaxID=2309 RepID=A0A0V8RX09_PYROC|nr:leucyl aminopeptidase [Pyrodictium occultum]KSW12573.1 peptidase M17 [Pyrodictium occultum]